MSLGLLKCCYKSYIYITVLVVTKSLCGFVSNQVQYDMESAQYLIVNEYILDIYI